MPYCRLIFNNNGQDPTFVKLEGCDINVLKSNVLNAERKKSVLVEDIMKLKSLISHHEDQLDILGQRLYDLRTHNTPASPRATVSSRRRSKDDVALSSTGKANGRRHRSNKSLFHEEVKTRSHRHHKSESHELENELFDTGTELQQELSEAKEHLDILETELQTLLTTQYESFPKSPSFSASLFAHRSKPFKSIIEIMNDLELENWQLVQCYTFIEENVQPQKNDNINKTSSNSSKSSARPLSGEVIANVFGNADLPEKISPRSTELSPQRETKVGRRSLVEKSQVAKLFGQTPQQRSTQPAAATSSNSSPAMDSLVHEKLPAATRGHSYDGVNVDVSRLSLNADGFAKRSTTINTSKSSEIRHVYVFHRPMKEVEWREVPTPRTVDDASDTSLPPLPRNLFESRELALPPIPKNKSK